MLTTVIVTNIVELNQNKLMWTKEKLEIFIKDYGFKPNQTKSEIKELPTILHPEEKLLGLAEGLLKKIHNRDVNGYGLVIATNKRVIFFRKSFIGTVTKEETPISKISSASFRKGILSSSIAIVTSNNESEVSNLIIYRVHELTVVWHIKCDRRLDFV